MSIRVLAALLLCAVWGAGTADFALAAGAATGALQIPVPAAAQAPGAVMLVTPPLSANGPGGTFTTPPLSAIGPRGSLVAPQLPMTIRKP